MTSKNILVTWISGLFTISVSGITITVCPSQIPGTPCQVICESADFSQPVEFTKDGNSIGLCLPDGTCMSTDGRYNAPHSIGTNQTVLNISAYDKTRDPGVWLCTAGFPVSTPKIMHYAIPPTSATLTPNNYTVNSTTHIIVTTDCAYINISGIIQFGVGKYSQSHICAEVPSGGCASGTGEKYTCNFTLNPGDMPAGTYELEFRVDLPYDNTNPKVNFTTAVFVTFPESKTNKTEITDERVIGIVWACCCPIELIVFILLLHYKIAIFTRFHVVNIAENPFQREMMYVLLFVGTNIFCSDSCVAVIVLSSTLTHYTDYREGLVSVISFLLIAVDTFIYMVIYLIVVVYVWGPRHARCCTNTINNSDLDTTIESTRISINGNAGLTSPGRRLPPLPPLIRTDPETPVKKEKKRRKKNKPELIEDQHAEKNNSEIKHEEGAEK